MIENANVSDALDRLVCELGTGAFENGPLILCLVTGNLPLFCAPMPRDPSPPTGENLDNGLKATIARALDINHAVHDGAIMARRRHEAEPYCIEGWSFRLFPPDGELAAISNRGSAFHSSLSMSTVHRVDRVYLVSRGTVTRFEAGNCLTLT